MSPGASGVGTGKPLYFRTEKKSLCFSWDYEFLYGFGPVGGVQLTQDHADVELDCPFGNGKCSANLLVRLPPGDQLYNLALTVCQQFNQV